MLRKGLAKIFSKEPSTSINATESASRGCAMAGAMISKSYVFQRNFDVKDWILYAIEMGWKSTKEGFDQSLEINKRDLIFKKHDQTPGKLIFNIQSQKY
jgi:molecular chaperone DnaK (HSP70)